MCRIDYHICEVKQAVQKNLINSWMINCETCHNVHSIGNKKCKKFTCNICNESVLGYNFINHLENECQNNGIIRTLSM